MEITVEFPGLGTLINMAAIVAGALVGVTAGHRVAERTRSVITDGLALVTMVMGIMMALTVTSTELSDAVGTSAPMLILVVALVLGSILGSVVGVEDHVARAGERLQRRFGGGESAGASARERFIEGFLSASLIFCIGPVAVLGSLQDGLGRGIDTLLLKSALDGMAAMAFAASMGVGVAFSALAVGVVQGAITLLALAAGDVIPGYAVAMLTVTGGALLIGIGIRIMRLKDLRIGDMLPSLVVAPLVAYLVHTLR